MDALSCGLGVDGAAGVGGGLEAVGKEILKAVDAARGGMKGNDGGGGAGGGGGGMGRVLLVLDGLDFLLAAMGVTALGMGDVVGEVREVCCTHFHSQNLVLFFFLL